MKQNDPDLNDLFGLAAMYIIMPLLILYIISCMI